ncbi:SphA family protein [Sandaracinobacteroides saxicola]|uniref:Transporter n=1 Tax=Sandaracinobacteroides saxicola TaxID=2759707 RepID=A0A7G5II41_9SPHN|nr:transporter [Sandaracinobacteroides saxicola]QMW23033.1 transporter [Sandaracinobacteroides saxicola]
MMSNRSSKGARLLAWAAAGLAATGLSGAVHAGEGGGSAYLQGTYGDFGAAVAQPKGVYILVDNFYYTARAKVPLLGQAITARLDQQLYASNVKLAWQTDATIFGGRYSATAVIPVIYDVNLRGSLSGIPVLRRGNVAGVGDIFLIPIQLNWKEGNHHITAAAGVVIPTGRYRPDAILNLSRNYWSIDPTVSYTYLDEEKGRDLSFTAGILFNFKNPDTQYKTGEEFHLDFNLGQYFSEHVGVGVTGYWYEQISSDSGKLPFYARNGFKGSGIGVGPSAFGSFDIGKQNIFVIGKMIFDVHNKQRLKGDIYMLSIGTKF